MKFQEAIKLAVCGRKIKRSHWCKYHLFLGDYRKDGIVIRNVLIGTDGKLYPVKVTGVTADDWEEYKEDNSINWKTIKELEKNLRNTMKNYKSKINKEEKNPMDYCQGPYCNKYLGFRGFCSKKCHDEYYDEDTKEESIKCPMKVMNIFPYGKVLVPNIKRLKAGLVEND